PATVPTTIMPRPPAPLSIVLAAKVLAGIAIRPDRNEPTDQDAEASRMTTIPVASPPAPPPLSETAATPPKPTSTPASVSTPGLSRTAILNTTSQSGT